MTDNTTNPKHQRWAAEFAVTVQAPLERLWNVLLDEMEHPESYSDTIKKSEVLERFAEGLLREVTVPDAKVREKLVYDFRDLTIVSTIVGHPELVGLITKTIEIGPGDQNLTLKSRLEWRAVEDRVKEMLTRNVKDFMMDQLKRVKTHAEQA